MAFTFFFRDRHTLDQLIRHLTPRIEGQNKIKIWDAGCAMGPEPYTFAILLAEAIGRDNYKKVEILASDIDESGNFGEIITDGIYPYQDLKRMPPEIFEKYFAKYDDKDHFKIDDMIKNSVKFLLHDLLTLNPPDRNFDAIICKNVLLHFQPNQRADVIKMFHSVLKPHGLFTTEQTQAMPDSNKQQFNRLVTDACVYEKK